MRFSTEGAQWLSGRVLDSRQKGRGFEPHRRHCVVVLEHCISVMQHIYPSLVLVQPRKTRPCLTLILIFTLYTCTRVNISAVFIFNACSVLPAKSDSDDRFCLQSYQGLTIDRSLVY